MLVVLWAIWLHQNKVFFRGRMAFMDGSVSRTWRDSWHPGSIGESKEFE